MNKVWYVLIILTFAYQVSFLNCYLSEQLVDMNLILARVYWGSSGLLGIILGAYVIFKVKIGLFGKMLSFMVMFFGIGLIGLWLLALGITSM
jgi:hypothetical protein